MFHCRSAAGFEESESSALASAAARALGYVVAVVGVEGALVLDDCAGLSNVGECVGGGGHVWLLRRARCIVYYTHREGIVQPEGEKAPTGRVGASRDERR